MDDRARIMESGRLEVWRNYKLSAWVEREFKTDAETSAAWSMFAHLCNEYPGVRELIRGELKDSVEICGGEPWA
jgi:hypothetical protein